MYQAPKPPPSPSRLASPATSSPVHRQDDESDRGITERLEGSSTLKGRKRENELHNEGNSSPSKKASRPLMNRVNPTSSNTAKKAELINSNFNESHIIGNVGTRTTRNKKNVTGQSNPDAKGPKLTSGSSGKKLDQLGTPPPDKTLKPKNPRLTGSKKRKREEAEKADIDTVNNQMQLRSSKEALPSAMSSHSILDSQDNTPSSSARVAGTQQPSGAIPAQRTITLNLSPAQMAQLSAKQDAATEDSAATLHTPPYSSHKSAGNQPPFGVDLTRIRIKFRGYEAVQESARRAARRAAQAARAAQEDAQRAARRAATENVEVSPHNPPSSSSTAPKNEKNPTKKNNARKKTEKKKKVSCGAAQAQWMGMQSPSVQKKSIRKADEAGTFFPNDIVIQTKEQNGKLVERCYGDYFVPQDFLSSFLRTKQAESADTFTYKVYLPSSFSDILVHDSCMPKYFKYTTATVSEAGLQKKVKIERMIRAAKGEKLMFEFDPSLGENDEIERQFANEFKFGESLEHDRVLKKDLRRRMKEAMTELESIKKNGLPFKEMRRYSLNFAEPTKKERIVELKQTILQQIEKEKNSETYEGRNERTQTAEEEWAAFQRDAQLLLDFSRGN
ncbi:hypothetical protein EYC80_010006 [Monilinia laxa]|nr:hypothetical protein EYC80_010006 [Monilinia laxa]